LKQGTTLPNLTVQIKNKIMEDFLVLALGLNIATLVGTVIYWRSKA
jgi:hypothetical protein